MAPSPVGRALIDASPAAVADQSFRITGICSTSVNTATGLKANTGRTVYCVTRSTKAGSSSLRARAVRISVSSPSRSWPFIKRASAAEASGSPHPQIEQALAAKAHVWTTATSNQTHGQGSRMVQILQSNGKQNESVGLT